MNVEKIMPALRYPGSKFKKLDKIFSFIQPRHKTFIDLFAGSGIVGVNASLFMDKTYINDYDKIFPISDELAVRNMCSFQGLMKSYTKSAEKYFYRRIKNGYWNKLDTYNAQLEKCIIHKKSYIDFINQVPFKDDETTIIFVDPPYHGIKGLYKYDFEDEWEFVRLRQYLSNCLNSDIIITINDTPYIREVFSQWYIFEEEYQYLSGAGSKKKKVKELIITNFKPKEKKHD